MSAQVKETPHGLLMKVLYEKTGAIPDGKAQGAAAKWLIEHEYSVEDCAACLDWLLTSEWREHRISLLNVKKEIGTFLAKRKPAPAVQPEGEADRLSHQEAAALLDDLMTTDEEGFAYLINLIRSEYLIQVSGPSQIEKGVNLR